MVIYVKHIFNSHKVTDIRCAFTLVMSLTPFEESSFRNLKKLLNDILLALSCFILKKRPIFFVQKLFLVLRPRNTNIFFQNILEI